MRRETTHRDANRLKHAARLWKEYASGSAPRQLDRWLADALRAEKSFGSQDRRFYSDIFFSAARNITRLMFLEFLAKEKGFSRAEVFIDRSVHQQVALVGEFSEQISTEDKLWAAVQSIAANQVVENAHQATDSNEELQLWVEVIRLSVGRIEADPRALADQLPMLLVACGIPPAWSASLCRRIVTSSWTAPQLLDFLKSQNERPPLWIRLNHPERCAEVLADLSAHGLEVRWIVEGYSAVVSGSFGVYQCASFKSGLFEVQDGASQQIAQAVDAKPGQKIWDACAGGGGKTVALAAALKGKGALYASDIRSHKLEETKRRCQRAGFDNVRTLTWRGDEPPKFGKEIYLQSGFDAVLVDAPCSSSGTWRRNPDARLRVLDPTVRGSLHALQLRLLTQAATRVRPGGKLVYGTCSWCVEENEDVVAAFLSEHSGSSGYQQTHERLLGAPLQNSDTMFAATLSFPHLSEPPL